MPSPTPTAPLPILPFTRAVGLWIHNQVSGFFQSIGHLTTHALAQWQVLLSGSLHWRQTLLWIERSTTKTFIVAALLVVFASLVIALQIAQEMMKQGAANYIGMLVSMAIIRELAPIMSAVAMIAVMGSAVTAELCSMQMSKQLDALQTLDVNPVRYLTFPRVLAAMVALPMIALITAVLGILAGLVISRLLADLPPSMYLESIKLQTTIADILHLLLKSSLFGWLLMHIATTFGLNFSGSSRELGQTTTRAVVWAFLSIALCDYAYTLLAYTK